MGRTLFSSVRSSSPVCGESSSLRRSKAHLVSASSSSQASSSSAVLSSLASMDLAQGFLPHKPIKKREKGERVYAEREREREGEGNPLCTTAVYNRPRTATHECHTQVLHTRMSTHECHTWVYTHGVSVVSGV